MQTDLYKTNILQIRTAFETHETNLIHIRYVLDLIPSLPCRVSFSFSLFPIFIFLAQQRIDLTLLAVFVSSLSVSLPLSLAVRLPLSFSDRVPRCVVSFPTNWTRLRRSSSRRTCVPVCWHTCVSTSGPLLIIMPGEAVRQGTARAFLTFHLLAAKEPVKDQWLSSFSSPMFFSQPAILFSYYA